MIFYDVAFIIFSILYIPFAFFKKGKRVFNLRPRFGVDLTGLKGQMDSGKNIWIHAVSVGEVMVLGPFLDKIKSELAGARIVLSVTTKTGYEIAKKNFSEKAAILYSPVDLSFVVRRFFNAIRPDILIVVETEIWPNLLAEAKKRSVPVVLINGRISYRSFKRYVMAKPLLIPTLKKIDLFCMQGAVDAARIIAIGAQKQKVEVTGNMKFDAVITVVPDQDYRIKMGLGEKDILLVAGSTHKGEEKVLLEAYESLKREFDNLRLLIAPRHVNRAGEIKKLTKNIDGVFVLNTMGHLKNIYAAADIVFIGGSLIPHGGQNPIEPAYFARPIIFGPYMFNFQSIKEALLKEKAAIIVKGAEELKEAVKSMMRDTKKAKAMGFFAKKAIGHGRGATARNFAAIKNILLRVKR